LANFLDNASFIGYNHFEVKYMGKRFDARYHLEFNERISLEEMEMIQIGRLHCSEETVVEKHMHLD
jgi:hypothetical protein